MSNETEQGQKRGGAILRLAKAGGVVAALVVVEMVAAAMIVPSAKETEQLARELAHAAKGEEAPVADADPSPLSPADETVEVELYTDNVSRYSPESDTTLNLQVSVYGVILTSEQVEFDTHYAAHANRIKEQINLTLIGADAGDLVGAGLGLIKRQILEKTNRTIGRPMVREVVFARLNFVQR
ncbi:hypothetical protein [Botrimarina sp.]|uniref:hypothetical protein n=1 Tax=Botrimarina sp. TaxID=2795802 RepID=UPI0032EC517D